ncbi:3-dehydroquinate synthase [Verrucomicrobia bacterium]|jgi:3-dehydroquinate synthase|nr:3-dehydroquinate synthase [Verrucomicrobiota bacterium]MDA7866973.1 3-dehydroquinate synthase [Verrucomicrobiota bacterium]MDB4746276.1 3-dehydroquinate synthase [Verrucomicrobiota bacterium]MDB4798587.1 3-dehydroquinate synthase [Verrucomicrobiota bacterium]
MPNVSSIEKTIRVEYSHRIFFTRGVFDKGNDLLSSLCSEGSSSRVSKVFIIIDEAVAEAIPLLAPSIESYFEKHQQVVELVCPPVLVEGGERVKNSYFHVSEVHSRLDRYHVDRHSYVIAIGGGALLDMVGLAAATAHRGVRHIRIPTTTLSQDDSGVGVKNGINAFGKKNFIGTFAPPHAVVNDLQFLDSLPDRDKRAGYSEAVKVALIRDGRFFESLEKDAVLLKSFDSEAMERLVRRCAELHVEHIAGSGDPFEFGSARPLDFGHWAAHKLEQISDYRIRHGEAVAIGVALDTVYSGLIGLLDPDSVERVLRLFADLGMETYASELHYTDSEGDQMLLRGLEEFREHLGGDLTITLLEGIGQGVEVHSMNLPKVVEALAILRDRFNQEEQRIVMVR